MKSAFFYLCDKFLVGKVKNFSKVVDSVQKRVYNNFIEEENQKFFDDASKALENKTRSDFDVFGRNSPSTR